jgi:tripartite-type tricarboxylate transporter receptor subunit TctC
MRRSVLSILALAAFLAGTSPSAAQQPAYPSKPVKIILPIPAGTALDVVVRALGDQLRLDLGQPVVVENRPGGGGIIAAQAVTSADPDGHTLLGAAASIYTILPAQGEKLPINVNRELAPVGMIGGGPMYLAVPPKLGVNSFNEFVTLARSQPHKLALGTNGAGTLPHFAALALAKRANAPITVVPYAKGGTTEAIRDILGGRVHGTIEAIFGLRGAIQSGDLKLIGVMSSERAQNFPAVPTVAETVPGLTAVGWVALSAPAATPQPIMQRLNAALNKALRTADVMKRFDDLGLQAQIQTTDQTRRYIDAEQKLWWPIVKEATPQQ